MIPKTKTYLATIILIGLFISSGCSTFGLPEETGVLLFQDDFSSINSGWDRYKSGTYSADYDSGFYRIEVFQKNHEAWALPGLNFSDAIIEATATKTNGPEDNVFGILCRYKDQQNFYFFLISSDGYAGIGLYLDGERSLLSGESMLPSEAILQSNATNDLKVLCVDESLILEVNGTRVYEVQSSALHDGDVGLIAGSYEKSGITVLFDNFSVRNP
jgi:hypothetical protein